MFTATTVLVEDGCEASAAVPSLNSKSMVLPLDRVTCTTSPVAIVLPVVVESTLPPVFTCRPVRPRPAEVEFVPATVVVLPATSFRH